MGTNFDRYLEGKLKDPDFAGRFDEASRNWDIALQIARLREKRGLSQAALARAAGTTQQMISRLESASYRGHSRSTLEKIAKALDARLVIKLEPVPKSAAPKGTKAPRNGKRSPSKGTRRRPKHGP